MTDGLEERIKLLEDELHNKNSLILYLAVSSNAARLFPPFLHEIRRFLSLSAMMLDALFHTSDPREAERYRIEITEAFETVRRIYESVSNIALGWRLTELARLDSLISESMTVVEPLARVYGIALHFDADPEKQPLLVPKPEVQTVLLNLLLNAIEAQQDKADSCAVIRVELRLGTQSTTVVIRDNGHGISPTSLPHIWDPGFTTKPHKPGMGLAIVKDVVESLGGKVVVDSVLNEGTQFTISLPNEQEAVS